MDPMPKLSREQYLAVMRQRMEEMLGQVADAINNAPDGYVIAGSEEQVRDLFADMRQQAFELGLQMRIDAAEAAFPPSEALPEREEPTE
jgi:acyl transferase domain-containing protein